MILLGLLDNFGYSPSLILGKGTGLHNLYGIADIAAVQLIMSLQLYGALDDLLVEGVTNIVLDSNYNSLIHLVAYYLAHSGLSQISLRHSVVLLSKLLALSELFLPDDGLYTGDVLLDSAKTHGVLELVDRVLETQVEKLALQIGELLVELLDGEVSNLRCLHYFSTSSSFFTNLHLTGSL